MARSSTVANAGTLRKEKVSIPKLGSDTFSMAGIIWVGDDGMRPGETRELRSYHSERSAHQSRTRGPSIWFCGNIGSACRRSCVAAGPVKSLLQSKCSFIRLSGTDRQRLRTAV